MASITARISMFIAALVATAAIAAPVASADPPYGTQGQTGHAAVASQSTTNAPANLPPVDPASKLRFNEVTASPHGSAFDWSAAGFGALAAAFGSVVLIGVGRDLRRRHQPTVA